MLISYLLLPLEARQQCYRPTMVVGLGSVSAAGGCGGSCRTRGTVAAAAVDGGLSSSNGGVGDGEQQYVVDAVVSAAGPIFKIFAYILIEILFLTYHDV